MNQILDFSPRKNTKSVNVADNKGAKIFAIACIIFSILMIVKAVYGITSVNNNSGNTSSATQANIEIEVLEEQAKAVIKVTHDKAIEKIIYNWNSSPERIIKIEGSYNTYETAIDLPNGVNQLYVKVLDINHFTSSITREITSNNGVDISSPEINITKDGSKLQIVAKDDTELSFITYRWNDEQETRIEASEENKKEISVTVDVPIDSNDITVEAVDKSNNTGRKTQTVVGISEPEVDLKTNADGSKVIINANHERGILRLDININGTDYFANYETRDEKPKTVNLELNLNEGYNLVKVKATSINNTYREVEGQCTYTPPAPETNTIDENTVNNENVANTSVGNNTNTQNTNTQNTNTQNTSN